MTRVFERPTGPGPVCRAFVIGVGAYPAAKPGNAAADCTTPKPLRDVNDLPSAATSAALFTDWLIGNADDLAAPLASIDLLLNVMANGQVISAYEWASRLAAPAGGLDPRSGDKSVDEPSTANVKTTGEAWKYDLIAGAGNLAIFYICGHGAILGSDNIVFLSDLNGDKANPWGALVNIQTHASAFKVMPSIGSAYFFVDACSELVVDIALQNPGVGAQFATANGRLGDEKVTILAAATAQRQTYEGGLAGQPYITAGRFTQCLLTGLQGGAVRFSPTPPDWTVYGTSLFESLKPLYELRTDWPPMPFQPCPPMLSADQFKLVNFAQAPKVPFRIQFVPSRQEPWALELVDHQNNAIDTRPACAATDWLTEAEASLHPYSVKATSAVGANTIHLITCQSQFSYKV